MYNKKTHLHFVGIGGIGMSALAHILHQRGYRVSGCDANIAQKSVELLIKSGCPIYNGNDTQQCHDDSIDVVVYSTALIHKNNQAELIRAKARNIPVIHRADMLAELMRTAYSIGVTGTHGKTTTTSLVAHILLEAQYDPTIIVGGHINILGSNARAGNSHFLVAEVDESDRSLLKLFPTIAIITNIGLDHLETYSNLHDITHTMNQFLEKIPFYGTAIMCLDSEPVRSLLPLRSGAYTTYGHASDAEFKIGSLQEHKAHSTFTVHHKEKSLGAFTLSIPGACNVSNAVAAFIAARQLGISDDVIKQALSTFTGVDRRFTFKGVTPEGAEVFDDYGHHPTEIKNSLSIARNHTSGKVRVLFQPHRYSRTHLLWNDFLKMFLESPLDELIITDIYAASEAPIEGVTSLKFAEELLSHKPSFAVHYIPLDEDYNKILTHLQKTVASKDIVMLQGAGPVNGIAPFLIKKS